MCSGPTSAQQNLQQEEADFYQKQIDAYNTAYSKYQGISDLLSAQFDPILKAGPGQFGYTPEETAALRTQATEGVARNYNQAAKAVAEQGASMGGGTNIINATGGPMTQARANLAAQAAQTQSGEQLGITTTGYDVGRQQWQNAIAGEENLAAGWNPNSFSGSATNAAGTANSEANVIAQENQAPWNAVLGALGGVASSTMGGWSKNWGA